MSKNAITILEPVKKTGSVTKSTLLTKYLAEIRKYPVLSYQEEQVLARRYFDEGDEEAATQLVSSNLRLVVRMAFKYHSQWSNVLDLIQQGNIGLLQALQKYDPYNPTKTKFSSYAAYWIRSCIYSYIKDNYRMVRLGSTRHGRQLFDNLRKEREKLLRQGKQPTTKALSESLSIPEEEIIMFSQHFNAPALSLDAPMNSEDQRTLEEVIESDSFHSPEKNVVDKELSNIVQDKIDAFAQSISDEREMVIWTERLLADKPKSLKHIGDRYGVSKERIRQVEYQIKVRFKKFLEDELGPDHHIDLFLED